MPTNSSLKAWRIVAPGCDNDDAAFKKKPKKIYARQSLFCGACSPPIGLAPSHGLPVGAASMTEDHDAMAQQSDTEALDWIVALQEAPDDDVLRAQFEAWRCFSSLNAAAWEETAQVYTGIGETEPRHSERWSHLRDRDGSSITSGRPSRRHSIAGHRHLRRHPVMAIALSAAAAAVLGVVIAPEMNLRWQADALAETGEVRALTLEDGTRAYLAPKSAIKVAYSSQARRITLLRGTAWFDVKHGADRPFQVVAGDVTTTDIGTAFEVRMVQDQVHVAVEEGIVKVEGDVPNKRVSERLTAGQTISIGSTITKHASSPELMGAWRDGQLAVQDQPMSDVVEALRPWYKGLIIIRSDRFAQRHVTGIYDLRHPADAMRALTKAYGGRVTQITPWLMVLSQG
ncbi:FecR family protein [Novosphingobium sp. BL-8A]|uniref:FecR family protein n=1 Tax=Novosphingobium sp. BL-8A TaxID=3127639 RepID=UPI0037565F88